MESTDGSAPHGYGLRSHGPVTTEPIPSDAMVSSGLIEAISSAEDPALGARSNFYFRVALQSSSHPISFVLSFEC
jgi:hypothetical protein